MEGIFNNVLLFKNNRLLYFLLFSGNFFGGQGFEKGKQSCDGVIPQSPTRENIGNRAPGGPVVFSTPHFRAVKL